VWIETKQGPKEFSHNRVTPHAGVWIETATAGSAYRSASSRLMQACGLKPGSQLQYGYVLQVTPHAGVWIETSHVIIPVRVGKCHASCRRVD